MTQVNESHFADRLISRIRELGHDSLSTHGIGRELSKEWWQAFLRQLVSAGHLSLDIQGYGGLQITATGNEILHGEGMFECREQCASFLRRSDLRHEARVQDASRLARRELG